MTSKQDCAVYLSTIQANVFKILFEALKELLGDVNMVFTPDGVRILEMDQYHTLMVDLFLDKKKLAEYYCPKNIVIGISVPNLHKMLKTMNGNSVLTMYMTNDNLSALEIVIDSSDSTQRNELTLDLMDLEANEDLGFPDEDYNLTLDMSSIDFKQICQNTKNIEAKQIKITYSKGIYTFSAVGNIGRQKITRPSQVAETEETSDEIFEAVFDLDKLHSFTKCSSISKDVKIYLGNDLPLICEYELSCGLLQLLLGQIDED